MIVVDKKHSKVSELIRYNVLKDKELKKLTIFTTIRNPFDMVLSNYFFEKQIYEKFKLGIWLRLVLGSKNIFFYEKNFN